VVEAQQKQQVGCGKIARRARSEKSASSDKSWSTKVYACVALAVTQEASTQESRLVLCKRAALTAGSAVPNRPSTQPSYRRNYPRVGFLIDALLDIVCAPLNVAQCAEVPLIGRSQAPGHQSRTRAVVYATA